MMERSPTPNFVTSWSRERTPLLVPEWAKLLRKTEAAKPLRRLVPRRTVWTMRKTKRSTRLSRRNRTTWLLSEEARALKQRCPQLTRVKAWRARTLLSSLQRRRASPLTSWRERSSTSTKRNPWERRARPKRTLKTMHRLRNREKIKSWRTSSEASSRTLSRLTEIMREQDLTWLWEATSTCSTPSDSLTSTILGISTRSTWMMACRT